jgi:mannose-6-phosphate isomerase-like protein (cupin superfamily)
LARIGEVIHRPWGSLTILEEGPHYRIKRVVIEPGRQMTLHQHFHRSEHWIVISGTLLVLCRQDFTLVTAGTSTFVPPCAPHRLVNPGILPAQMVEVQSGSYLGEDDMQVLDRDPYVVRH